MKIHEFNFPFWNFFNHAASNLRWIHERYNWCVNSKCGLFLTDHLFRIAYCAGAVKSVGICTIRSSAVHATPLLLRERRETCTLTRSGSFRVFADQESRKRIGHRRSWMLFAAPTLCDDSRGQRRARKSAIAQSAVAQSDRECCLCVLHTKALSPAI